MSAKPYYAEIADAARNALAFVLAVQRNDTEAMEVTSPQAPAFESQAQREAWAANRSRAFFEHLQQDAAAGIRTW